MDGYNKQIDIAKGIGICLVVLGHCSTKNVTHFIYLFHMPLFFMIAGYLFNDKNLQKPKEFFIRKVKRLYLTYLVYEVVFTLLRNYFINVGFYSTDYKYVDKYINDLNKKETLKVILQDIFLAGREPLVGTLWFIVSLIFVIVMFYIISLIALRIEILLGIKMEQIRLIMVLLLFLSGNLGTKYGVNIPRCNNSMVMVAVFYMGYILRNYIESKFNIQFNLFGGLIAFLLLIMNMQYGSVSVNSNKYLSPDFLICNSALGFYLTFSIAKWIQNTRFEKVFISLGKRSMSIMILHFTSFKFVTMIIIYILDYSWDRLCEFPILTFESELLGNVASIPYFFVGLFIPLVCSIIWSNVMARIKNTY